MTDTTEELEARWDATWHHAHWVNRVFGSWGDYEASLPVRLWERTANGWSSAERGDDNWAAV